MNRLKNEPALIIAALAMLAFTVYRVAVNDIALEEVLTEDYMTYAMGAVAAIFTRFNVFSSQTLNKRVEAELVKNQDLGDAPDVRPRKF